MKPATLEFVKQRFSDYYRAGILTPPPSAGQREWAFVFFDPDYPDIRMRRHIGFTGNNELLEYIRNMAPAHLYYSVAYYRMPHAPTMPEKGWLGADIVFDLDADHIVRGPYDMMLSRVKEETTKLIDYLCGIGIDPGTILFLPSPSPRGWHQRYIAALTEYLLVLEGMDQKEALADLLTLEGVGKVTAEEFLKRAGDLRAALAASPPAVNLKDATIGRVVRALAGQREGKFISLLREKAALADEPVTTDVKRLIRMPTSLHGGSGFRVTPLSIRELDDFDPLTDAVVFGTRDVRVDSQIELSMPLLGNRYRVAKGESVVPEALAVFLCCRGLAEIAGRA